DALGGEQNGVQFWLYLRPHALKRHAWLLLLVSFLAEARKVHSPREVRGKENPREKNNCKYRYIML
ncbi:MAG: hypothetical protein J5860_04315, partial [Clostridia bacterium]|nr:hypothetical protein [Clostridia bacterium]